MTDQLAAFLQQNPNIKTLWVDQNFNYVTCPCVGYKEVAVTELVGAAEEQPGVPVTTEEEPKGDTTENALAAEEQPGVPKADTKGKKQK